uniref:Transmembrane protein 71 n=1 Tax=Rousettus aegyptiacus TaxID=9407 RepID=A0A7J8C4I6_ROUAE|nr:transmembrane protein 71 [Rousettus aegyptiacus]
MPRFTFLRSTDQPLTHCVFTGLTVNDPSLPGTIWFLGGILASVFTCFLAVTIAYVVKSLFLSLASYFKATTCVRFAKFDSHSGVPLMNVFSLDTRKLSDLQSAWNSCFIGRK